MPAHYSHPDVRTSELVTEGHPDGVADLIVLRGGKDAAHDRRSGNAQLGRALSA